MGLASESYNIGLLSESHFVGLQSESYNVVAYQVKMWGYHLNVTIYRPTIRK